MPDFVILRLKPATPVDPGKFTTYLKNLTIKVYDVSFAHPKAGTKGDPTAPIGTATYNDPTVVGAPPLPPPFVTYPAGTGIAQHFSAALLAIDFQGVATAVVQVNLPAAEYPTTQDPDLRIVLDRGGAQSFFDPNVYYDAVTISMGGLPSPDQFQNFQPPNIAAYITLPAPVDPGQAQLQIPTDGTMPNFDELLNAVKAVLGKDPGGATSDAQIAGLTVDQCRNIAYEIVWGPKSDLPIPPEALEPMYTNPPNNGSGVGTNTNEQDRQDFEGSLNSYYSKNNAIAEHLTQYIYALAAAVSCTLKSQSAPSALVGFPVNPGVSGTLTTISEGEVILEGLAGNPLQPKFEVPAAYFYVLAAQMPTQLTPEQRLQMATRGDQLHNLTAFRNAFETGVIDDAIPNSSGQTVNPAQAARILTALAVPAASAAAHCPLVATLQPLMQDWLNYPQPPPPSPDNWKNYHPGDDITGFWPGEAAKAAMKSPFLDLVLCALTDDFAPLVAAIKAIPINDVTALAAMTAQQWRNLFGTPPTVALLPPFTQPGTPEAQVEAFIQHVRKFFDMPSGVVGVNPAVDGGFPGLALPSFDPIGAFATAYDALIGGGFTFGTAFVEVSLQQAIANVFPGDQSAQAWLEQVLRSLNDLCKIANVQSNLPGPPPMAASLAFSAAEALYARGFTRVGDVQAVTQTDFEEALRGTVAFDLASAIYAAAVTAGPPTEPSPGPFHPVNPGSLTNCIPPCHLSPLGPVEYLHEILEVSELSTCDDPFAPPASGKQTLGDAIATRRGPLGDLEVSVANLQTEIPRIDLVNECLEKIAANVPAATPGAVYNTAADEVAGHRLCEQPTCPGPEKHQKGNCHKPVTLFSTLPEHSSPAVPVEQAAAYDRLKGDFSSPLLPYSQPLDICRSYLQSLGTCRYETMRAFRKEITEFTLDPTLASPTFQSHLWRYPVRIEIAVEYLGITPEEYDLLFSKDIVEVPTPGHLLLSELYGFDQNALGGQDWTQIVVKLPEFLKRTGLTYCEFLELKQSEFVKFVNGSREGYEFPECEPCCLEKYTIQFDSPSDLHEALKQLALFIRLWRKLREVCCARYTFIQLRDICEVLQFLVGAAVNPDFIRQLAAFQILRDQFRLKLTDKSDPSPGTGADRTHLLALWVGPAAHKWGWAVDQVLERIEHYAKRWHKCEHRGPEFIKVLGDNLDPLSRLAGFDPTQAADTWHARPTNTLRFVEVLAKIYASYFGVGEILYLFTTENHLDGDDPFPLQSDNEALDDPLELPDDEREFSLWVLRRKLLSVEVSEEEAEHWTWTRIVASLRHEFGYAPPTGGPDPLTSLGEHFFPHILESAGIPVDIKKRQYRVDLAGTPAAMWNTPPDGPFHYDDVAQQLWIKVPLRDEAVLEKLGHLRQFTAPELQAVQNLYFSPRVDLAPFSSFFPDFAAADQHLIQEPDESERWRYFRRHFAITYARCKTVASHLSHHVAFATDHAWEHGSAVAWLVLRHLFADENAGKTAWEDDTGKTPDVTWTPDPNGGAFAALLGLTGTGLLGEFTPAGGSILWREVRGPMNAFGHDRNKNNCPEPTVLPAMDLSLSGEQLRFVSVRNGLGIQDEHGNPIGGAQGFGVRWSGVLMIEREGTYDFRAGAPTPNGEEPDFEAAEHRQWRITITRGQKTWIVLSHHWPGEESIRNSCLHLKRGAYQIIVEYAQPEPDFSKPENICPQRGGFQVKYSGPDSDGSLIALPLRSLFRDTKDQTLGYGIDSLDGTTAKQFLDTQFTSTLRDIRRTYQRAFKALLFAHRFGLSATPVAHYGVSELGFMLTHDDRFVGISYFRDPVSFSRHAANFDFNFLPLLDNYHSPAPAHDLRVQPSAKRMQALFDWWERMFDYTRMRREARSAREHPVWLLFLEAAEDQPDNPGQLLRHMGVDLRHADAVLHYYQDQTTAPYEVSFDDLEDDRWAVRVWHGERWCRHILRCFAPDDIKDAKPYLWASEDPSALVGGNALAGNGNANLTTFVDDGGFESGAPRRYEDIRRLNNCLRERARAALLAYLNGMNRVSLPWGSFAQSSKDFSDFLLLDVDAGTCEKASRIEDAITAVQNFIQRARLGLESGWDITYDFGFLWDRKFASFKIWESCKRRELYRENWIGWEELEKAKKVEAFRFLESELRRCTLTVPVAGGLEYWPDQQPPTHTALMFLQKRDPSSLTMFQPREGLGLLGTPERDARPSWLAPVSGDEQQQPPTPVGVLDTTAIANPAASSASSGGKIPFWIEAAIRLGVRFYRIAAAGVPPASTAFEHRDFHSKPRCCVECGCTHPPLVDEYYFWLVDSKSFRAVDQSDSPSFSDSQQDDYYDPATQQSLHWHDESDLPNLLDWKPSPTVRLAWCRVHNGEFQQPRRSHDALDVTSGAAPDLAFLGRLGDSLTFQVTTGIGRNGYTGTDLPGFRYELATDDAVVLPLLVDPTAFPGPFPAGLPVYPYFVYVDPGDRLFPTVYSPAIAVASLLRSHCRFEAALKWYDLVFNPLEEDSTWVRCPEENPAPEPQPDPNPDNPNDVPVIVDRAPRENDGGGDGENGDGPISTCCDTTQITDEGARDRSVLLQYLETLLEWGNALMCRNYPESFQKARLIFDTMARILGPYPHTVINEDSTGTQTVSSFVPLPPALNPRLLELYCHVKDRLELIHHCLNCRRLLNGCPNLDMPYWGEKACRADWRSDSEVCAKEEEWCSCHSPYRFLFLLQKAQETANQVREMGAALQTAFEKSDAEYLASLRSQHEVELLDLTRVIRQDQWREADWQRQGLEKSKEVAQTNRRYYARLIQNGLNGGELEYEELMGVSLATRTAGNIVEAIAEIMDVIPDIWVGFPCEETQLPIGTKLAGLFKTIARVTNNIAEMASTTAAINLTESGWVRRAEEWVHQVEDLDIEIQQIERQILGAERHRDQALLELNNQQRQFEQSTEVQNFLRNKFTNHALFLWLQKESSALYYRMYELAIHNARQAERAFNFERGYTHRKFLSCECWDTLHEGLLAGERLQLALRRMEKEYLDCNAREYELTKHISLRMQFPVQFLRLKMTGYCEIEIPEWMFDLDYPGQYMRRIRNVSLTIPCVTGPFTGVHCRLTLLSSQTRVDPCLTCPPAACCGEESEKKCQCESAHCSCSRKPKHSYEVCPDDWRIVKKYAAREAIATSSGQNDTGMFELNFRDERYLPFEFLGAVSRWRIELPPENNCFDMETLSDVILHLNYTSREGGDLLWKAASECAQQKLPGDGWCFFDVRHEFPDAWQLFQERCRKESESARELCIGFSCHLFPYLPCDPDLRITKIALLFETSDKARCDCPEVAECPCPDEREPACHVIEFDAPELEEDEECECLEPQVNCLASAEWPTLYNGVLEIKLGPLRKKRKPHKVTFRFPACVGTVSRVFLLCRYEARYCDGRHKTIRCTQEPCVCQK